MYVQLIPRRWVRTGDEVMFDADEDMFVTDRIKVRGPFRFRPVLQMP